MARPDEWRGSDLRSRAEVVQYLVDHGGEVVDKSGLLTTKLRAELNKGRAVTQLLADMEADGMIKREVRGRRTFRLTLVDDWGLTSERHLRSVPVESSPDGGLALSTYSPAALDQLADVLLARVIRKATEPAQPSSEQREAQRTLTQRLKSAEQALDTAQRQLRAALGERRTFETQLIGANERIAALENNLALMQRELTRKPRRGGVPIAERLSDDERRLLDDLMRALPETPESKPRAEPRKRR